MQRGRFQKRVTALHGVAVGVEDAAAHLPVGGTYRLHRIAHLQLYVAELVAVGECGEPLAVAPAHLIVAYPVTVIIPEGILKSQARSELSDRSCTVVLGKESQVLIMYLRVG